MILIARPWNGQNQEKSRVKNDYIEEHTKDQITKSKFSLGLRGSYKSRERNKICQEVRNESEVLL